MINEHNYIDNCAHPGVWLTRYVEMSVDKDFPTWLLINGPPCCRPITSQAWKFCITGMDFNTVIFFSNLSPADWVIYTLNYHCHIEHFAWYGNYHMQDMYQIRFIFWDHFISASSIPLSNCKTVWIPENFKSKNRIKMPQIVVTKGMSCRDQKQTFLNYTLKFSTI